MKIKFGIEEEVFVVEKGRPAIDSLYPLFSLVRKKPNYYFVHTAVNLARGRDLLDFFVASVEISTGVAEAPENAVEQLRLIREEFLKNCPQKVACVGMLPTYTEHTSLVSGFHIHVSGDFDFEEQRLKIVYYLPALLLITANSPSVNNDFLSNRILASRFTGAVVRNSYERYQDVIISRRLNTLEIRAFDPCPDLYRYMVLLEAIRRIITTREKFVPDLKEYAILREEAAKYGTASERIKGLVSEVVEKYGVEESLFHAPPALKTKEIFQKLDEERAYEELDRMYRQGVLYEGGEIPKSIRALLGFFGYYIPRLPYNTYKFLKEHGYLR